MVLDTAEFLKSSRLDICVPEATNIEIEELLENIGEREDDDSYYTQQRSTLYFGM